MRGVHTASRKQPHRLSKDMQGLIYLLGQQSGSCIIACKDSLGLTSLLDEGAETLGDDLD